MLHKGIKQLKLNHPPTPTPIGHILVKFKLLVIANYMDRHLVLSFFKYFFKVYFFTFV